MCRNVYRKVKLRGNGRLVDYNFFHPSFLFFSNICKPEERSAKSYIPPFPFTNQRGGFRVSDQSQLGQRFNQWRETKQKGREGKEKGWTLVDPQQHSHVINGNGRKRKPRTARLLETVDVNKLDKEGRFDVLFPTEKQ